MSSFTYVFAGCVLFLVAASICYGIGSTVMQSIGTFPLLFQMLCFIAGVLTLFSGIFYVPWHCIMKEDPVTSR